MIRFLLISGLLFSSSAFAALPEGAQFWNLSFLRGSLDSEKKWEYYLEFQPRFDLQNAKLSRFLLRPGVLYNLTSNQTLWVGLLDVFNSDVQSTEIRPWQQYQRIDPIDGTLLLNRTRLEERFKLGVSDIGLRLRHMIRAQIPISNTWWAVIFDEIFLGLNQNRIQKAGFDQNRAFVGVRKDIEENFFVETGYMNQLTMERINHIPFLCVGFLIR